MLLFAAKAHDRIVRWLDCKSPLLLMRIEDQFAARERPRQTVKVIDKCDRSLAGPAAPSVGVDFEEIIIIVGSDLHVHFLYGKAVLAKRPGHERKAALDQLE